jgi:hypothetical protein
VKFKMVNTAVPNGTNPSIVGSPPASQGVCAGVHCSNILPLNRGGDGPGGGFGRFCPECRVGLSQALHSTSQSTPNCNPSKAETSKNKFDQLTPDTSPLDPKKSRLSNPPLDLSEFSADLGTSSKKVLIDRVNKLIEITQTCIAEKNSIAMALKDTENAFNAFKIAFADEAFKLFTSRSDHIATNIIPPELPESSTLIATVKEAAADVEVDTQTIDRLLESSLKGPVPQFVKRKEGKMYISFSDAVQSGRAKSLLESKPEGIRLFESVNTQSRLFPVVALRVDISDLDALKKELVFRNPTCGFAIKQVRTIFRSQNNSSGHAKIFFDSKRVRDEVLRSGRLFADGKRIQVVEVDLNREVRRCYRCQSYGHIAKTSNNSCVKEEVCGYCAGSHSTRVCGHKGQPNCANCQKAHRSGDPSCPHQIRAVGRYRAAIEQ